MARWRERRKIDIGPSRIRVAVESRHQPPEITDELKRTWQRRRMDTSSGGVAFRRLENGVVEIALIATRNGTRWQLPKGSREAGETTLETAVREVEEEVGLRTQKVCFLHTIDFWYWDTYRKSVPELVHKRVDFFLLKVTGGKISDASHEVDGVAWFTLDQALDILTFPGERSVVHHARKRLSA